MEKAELQRLTGRVRVTRRVESDPDHRGLRRLIAREGEVLAASVALRRGIPADALESRSSASRIGRATVPLGPVPGDAAEPEDPTPVPVDDSEPAVDGDFPQHRGGNWWTLSDGSRVQGTREAATIAEERLQGLRATPGAADPDAAAEPEDTGITDLSAPDGDSGTVDSG